MWRSAVIVFYSLSLSVLNVEGNENCDKLGVLLYEDIGCEPVIPQGAQCPVKYECGCFRTKSCLLRGRNFDVDEMVNSSITYPSCYVGCFCNENKDFTCAVLDCPEWLGIPIDQGCNRKYEVDKCCSVGQVCPTAETNFTVPTCTFEGQTYREGEKFFPRNTCTRCVCPGDFNGKIEEPHCQRISCNVQITDSGMLSQNCAPFYTKSTGETLCCPSTWICPADDDKIIEINGKIKEDQDLTCNFGSKTLKLGEGFRREINLYGTLRKAECECILPPFLTCK